MPDPKEYRPFGSYGPKKSEEKTSSEQLNPDAESSADIPDSDVLEQRTNFENDIKEDNGHSNADLDDHMRVMLRKMAGDMTFVGAINFLGGALVSLSIIGAIIGIPVMVFSVRMIQSGSDYKRFSKTGDVNDLNEAFLMQRKSFFTQKVILIVVILLMILQIVLIYLFFDFLVGDLMRNYPFPTS